MTYTQTVQQLKDHEVQQLWKIWRLPTDADLNRPKNTHSVTELAAMYQRLSSGRFNGWRRS